jgi:lipopolysaccharide transport system permease protein
MTETNRPAGRPSALADLPSSWTTIISPHRGWLDWRLKQLWGYRDLVGLFVWRDFTSLYKQTILGPTWHVVQPLMTTLTFTVIFSQVARLSTDGAPPFLFYLAGAVLWNYFATTLTATSNTFLSNADLLGKVYFHRLVIPLSIVISNLIAFAIQFAIFLIALAWYAWSGAPVRITYWVAWFPVLLLLLAGYGLGGGIIVSALTTRYRDLSKLIAFGVQLLMFVTPVVYPLSMVPWPFSRVAALNPLTPVMEGFRRGFLGIGTVDGAHVAMSAGGAIVVLLVGLMLFTHVERTFMDTV